MIWWQWPWLEWVWLSSLIALGKETIGHKARRLRTIHPWGSSIPHSHLNLLPSTLTSPIFKLISSAHTLTHSGSAFPVKIDPEAPRGQELYIKCLSLNTWHGVEHTGLRSFLPCCPSKFKVQNVHGPRYTHISQVYWGLPKLRHVPQSTCLQILWLPGDWHHILWD